MLCKEISQQHNALLFVLLQFENPDINFQNLVELADNSRVVLDSISGLTLSYAIQNLKLF